MIQYQDFSLLMWSSWIFKKNYGIALANRLVWSMARGLSRAIWIIGMVNPGLQKLGHATCARITEGFTRSKNRLDSDVCLPLKSNRSRFWETLGCHAQIDGKKNHPQIDGKVNPNKSLLIWWWFTVPSIWGLRYNSSGVIASNYRNHSSQ